MGSGSEQPIIIDGRKFANEYFEKILEPRCGIFSEFHEKQPKLSTILVKSTPASESYLKLREKYFRKLCVKSEVHRLPEEITEVELLNFIDEQNKDESVDGILVQMPLPPYIRPDTVIEKISPSKDVEGLTPRNVYAWAKAVPHLIPATALGILALLKYYKIGLESKHIVIMGRSMIVGKPIAHLLLRENATITVTHSRSKPIEYYTQQADILVAAVGKAHLVKKGMIKKGAIVIDVGINMLNGKLVGDVDFEDVKNNTSYITPVPGGVGPATVCLLASNLFLAAELRMAKNDISQIRCLKEYYNNFEMIGKTSFCF